MINLIALVALAIMSWTIIGITYWHDRREEKMLEQFIDDYFREKMEKEMME